MAEVGGSHTDGSAVNLDSTTDDPSTSHEPMKQGALKRPAEVDKDVTIKKKRTAEEQAGTSKGRNVALKQLLMKEKKERKAEQAKSLNRAKMMEMREDLIAKLKEMEDRPMEMTDRAEQKMLEKEENRRKALITIEKQLEKEGLIDDEQMEKTVVKSLCIKIAAFPCLDTYVQDFALERLYDAKLQEKGTSMKVQELLNIINKVRSRDPTIRLPSEDGPELDRLILDVNCKIIEAVQNRRFGNLIGDLIIFPGVDPNFVEDTDLIVKLKQGEGENPNLERNELEKRVMNGCEPTGEEDEIECINLDDEDDRDKEGDEDELSDKSEHGDEEGADDDDELAELRRMKFMAGKKIKEIVEPTTEQPEEDPNDEIMDQPMEKPNEAMDQPLENPNETMELPMDIPNYAMDQLEENSNSTMHLPGDNPDESSNEKESMIEKTTDRPDSREGRDLEEGGTSTNSPTLDRDERMKELEKISEIKQAVIVMQPANLKMKAENNEPIDTSLIEEIEMELQDVANTIVLTDDEDTQEVQKIPKIDVIEVKEDEVIEPPKLPVMTHEEASKMKMREVRKWVEKSAKETHDTVEVLSLESDEEKEEDDEIQCVHDDFDWDSVSHSGLPASQQQVQQNPVQPPLPPPKVVKVEVEVIDLD